MNLYEFHGPWKFDMKLILFLPEIQYVILILFK